MVEKKKKINQKKEPVKILKKSTKKPARKVVKKSASKVEKEVEKKVVSVKSIQDRKDVEDVKKDSYIGAIGRRKTSVARVRFYKEGSGSIIVNKKNFDDYFPEPELKKIILAPLKKTDYIQKAKIEILAKGGGKRGQAEASRLGIARVLLKINSDFRILLKAGDFLKRDPREKERKKFGLKKARKAPQWSKR